MAKGKLVFDERRCKACGLCIRACPKDALVLGDHINAAGYRFVVAKVEDNCIGCGVCAVNCPDMVISVYKEEQ